MASASSRIGCGSADRLARLAGQLGPNEREGLRGEIVGQFGHDTGGLDKGPTHA
jgi:hypothetical protein